MGAGSRKLVGKLCSGAHMVKQSPPAASLKHAATYLALDPANSTQCPPKTRRSGMTCNPVQHACKPRRMHHACSIPRQSMACTGHHNAPSWHSSLPNPGAAQPHNRQLFLLPRRRCNKPACMLPLPPPHAAGHQPCRHPWSSSSCAQQAVRVAIPVQACLPACCYSHPQLLLLPLLMPRRP